MAEVIGGVGGVGLLDQMAALVYQADELADVYETLCTAAVRLIPGVDHASLMIRRGDRFVTAAASDDVARLADRFERELHDGPCVDAIEDEVPQLDADLTIAPAWPALADRLLEHTPVRGALAFRLKVDERKSGALNLFSDRPGALDDDSVDHAAVLTAFASVVLMAAAYKETAASLRQGLTSNREIGKATGLLMAYHQVSDAEAFDMLRTTSQDMNIKLAAIAQEVVVGHNRVVHPR